MNEKQENIINKLNNIADISQELMNMAITGDDGNLEEMSYHIKCYTKKIIVHLLKEWGKVKSNIVNQKSIKLNYGALCAKE